MEQHDIEVAFGNTFYNAAIAWQQSAWDIREEYCRPCVVFKAKITLDGSKYCCLLGENLQEGVAGFGDTPQAACHDFDNLFQGWGKYKKKGK